MAKKVSQEVAKYMSDIGRKAAKVRMQKLTKEQRRQIAVNAAKARWAKGKRR